MSKRDKSKTAGRGLPLGYVMTKSDGAGKRRIEFDPVRAPAIRRVFHNVASGKWTVDWAYLWLKYESSFTTRRGEMPTLRGVRLMLRNSEYCMSGKHGRRALVARETHRLASMFARSQAKSPFNITAS